MPFPKIIKKLVPITQEDWDILVNHVGNDARRAWCADHDTDIDVDYMVMLDRVVESERS